MMEMLQEITTKMVEGQLQVTEVEQANIQQGLRQMGYMAEQDRKNAERKTS